MHYGVLGMKWGIRRYQNYDGTLKNKKARDHAKENREKNEKKKINKRVLIGAGIAVGALAAAGLIYYNKNFADKVIKEGMTIQNLAGDSDRITKGEAFYAAYKKGDKNKYVGLFGKDIEGNKFKNTAQVAKDIKVASIKNGEKIFNDLAANNPEFKSELNKLSSSLGIGTNYKAFNTYGLLGDSDITGAGRARDIFYKAVKEKGYGGVIDINDVNNSGFNTTASIIFDRSGLTNLSSVKLTDSEINNAFNKVQGQMFIDNFTKKPKTLAAIGVTTGVGIAKSKPKDANQKEIDKAKSLDYEEELRRMVNKS